MTHVQYFAFFLGFSIQKMAASDHSEVSAYGLDLKKNLSSHFRNLKTLEKSKFYLDNFSSHLEKIMRERKHHFWPSAAKLRNLKLSKMTFQVIFMDKNVPDFSFELLIAPKLKH